MVMRTTTLLVLFCSTFVLAAGPTTAPVNPDASPEARALLQRLYDVSGKQIIAGQHNYPAALSQFSDHAAQLAGKRPLLWGCDFGYTASGKDAIASRPAIVREAIRQHQAGSIVTLMWHAIRPIDDEPNGWRQSILAELTDEQWNDLITPGTEIHQRWQKQVDVIADYLKQLQAAKVPVIWRPYHEMNGGWFWWGGRPGPRGYQALYRLLYDRLTHHHKLNNLLWVWNANAPYDKAGPYADYFPGHDCVDVLAADIYMNKFGQSYHDELLKLANGKPIALGEVGTVPTPQILDNQPRWCWFMTWCEFLDKANTPDAVRTLYHDPRVLTR